MINQDKFFKAVRPWFPNGKLTPKQVDGLIRIITYWQGYSPKGDLRHLAYMLATVYWETAQTMQPISEYGGQKYLKSKVYYPYYGRGLPQLTWRDNYAWATRMLHEYYGIDVDLVKYPDDAMKWEYALPIMFEGMHRGKSSRGDYTGKALEDYFNAKVDDPVGARRIINGTDKAKEIAAIHRKFLSALKEASK